MKLSRPHVGGRPLSNRIVVDLIDEMKNGIYKGRAQLPSEVELCARYGISRTMLRDALLNLEREGFVERHRSVGTVINQNVVKLHNRIDLRYEYNDLIRAMGGRPATDSVKIYLEPAAPPVAECLQLPVGADLIVCEKRLLADDRPVIYSIDRLPFALFRNLPYERIDWKLPLFDILELHRAITVDTDVARLSPVAGSPEIRRMLGLGEGEALIRIDETGYYNANRPVFHSYGYYTGFFEFTVLRKRF